jgi:hypothetical protein
MANIFNNFTCYRFNELKSEDCILFFGGSRLLRRYHKKGEIQKRKIVESEAFSVDERISIIRELFVIVSKKEPDIT